MPQENKLIRKKARAADVPLWKIAQALGISEPTLTRWLRFPLPADKEQRILTAISELTQEAG
jgi:transposase-like protein